MAKAFPRKPRMMKLFDGRNVATRPIPVTTTVDEERNIASAAAELKPKHGVVNMPSGPRVSGTEPVFGTKVKGAASLRGGVYNPSAGRDSTV